jgi:hypothetical protein
METGSKDTLVMYSTSAKHLGYDMYLYSIGLDEESEGEKEWIKGGDSDLARRFPC